MMPCPPFEPVFGSILAPMSPSTFLCDYWGRQPVVIRGREDKFSSLFSRERLWDSLRSFSQDNDTYATNAKFRGFGVRASFDRGETVIAAPPQGASHLFDSGAAVRIDRINLADRLLDGLIVRLRRETRFLGGLDFRADISPDGQRFGLYLDARALATLQIEGTKEWTFFRDSSLDWLDEEEISPNLSGVAGSNEKDRRSPPPEGAFERVILRQGDVLCLPAGYWHGTGIQGYSLSLNLVFDAMGGFSSTFGPALKQLMNLYPGWSAPVPPTHSGLEGGTRAPEAVHAFYRDRISELIEALELLRESPDVLDEAWSRLTVTPDSALTHDEIGEDPDERVENYKSF
jgi:ribosomal protein L16 Arg81 hydroxylase